MRLDPTALAAGFKLTAYDSLGSTNDEARVLAQAGHREPHWITARLQSAGRGRRGNVWVSEPGNLYCSLLLPGIPAGRAGELAFVAGLAVADAIAALAPRLRPSLKWPNDVLLGGEKVAGMLIEAEQDWAVIGVGVNCAHHPEDTAYPATDLQAAGISLSVETLFSALSAAMLARLAKWDKGAGFSAIRADWLGRAAGIGKDIRVRLPAKELAGQFQGLDETGHLLLRLADGSITTVSSGEVFALPAAR